MCGLPQKIQQAASQQWQDRHQVPVTVCRKERQAGAECCQEERPDTRTRSPEQIHEAGNDAAGYRCAGGYLDEPEPRMRQYILQERQKNFRYYVADIRR
jgi:hypothetical protein